MENPFITPHQKQDSSGREWGPINYGMTLLDYFAGQALIAYMRNCDAIKVNDGHIAMTENDNLAICCYDIAISMLKIREKKLKELE